MRWTALMAGVLLLCAVTAGAENVTVSWTYPAAEASRITEFRLYLTTTPGGRPVPIKIVNAQPYEYTITNDKLPGITTYLWLTAFDGTNIMESQPSRMLLFKKKVVGVGDFKIIKVED